MIEMLELDKKIKILAKHKKELARKYKIKRIGIFGSYVREEQKKMSDLDILVDFSETPSLFSFVGLGQYLSKLLGIKVDLVMKDALKPKIGKHILSEVVYV